MLDVRGCLESDLAAPQQTQDVHRTQLRSMLGLPVHGTVLWRWTLLLRGVSSARLGQYCAYGQPPWMEGNRKWPKELGQRQEFRVKSRGRSVLLQHLCREEEGRKCSVSLESVEPVRSGRGLPPNRW